MHATILQKSAGAIDTVGVNNFLKLNKCVKLGHAQKYHIYVFDDLVFGFWDARNSFKTENNVQKKHHLWEQYISSLFYVILHAIKKIEKWPILPIWLKRI